MSRCNFDGWSDVISEVPWCLSMQTTVRHEAELESDPLWHVQTVQFVVQRYLFASLCVVQSAAAS